MAKGDAKRVQNQLDYQGGLAQNYLNNTRDDIKPQNQALQNRYNQSADQSTQNYNQMFSGYNDLLSQIQRAFQPQRAGYQEFANTGGYSPQDIQDLRARAISPTRAVYANAQSNIDRQRALQGGYSPNYTAASAKLSRDLSSSISDANVNANASIADSIRQGKLAGLGGLNATDVSQLGALLNARSGQTSLYGTTPGATSMYGQQLGQSNSQMIGLQQLQQALAQMIINGQLGRSQVPGNYQQALGNIGSTLGLGGQIIGGLAGLGGGGSSVSDLHPF